MVHLSQHTRSSRSKHLANEHKHSKHHQKQKAELLSFGAETSSHDCSGKSKRTQSISTPQDPLWSQANQPAMLPAYFLKGGILSSQQTFGDPQDTSVFQKQSFAMLSQSEYNSR